MSKLERVFNRIEGFKGEIVSLQSDLTARVALGPKNGGTGEHEKAEYLRKKVEELRPDFMEQIEAPDELAQDGYRPNLLARWAGRDDRQTVWVLSHMDIVPPGDLSLWETDPYRIEVAGDKISGRGVEDNQHAIVSSYLALKAVLEAGETPPKNIGLAFVADEETGSAFGLDYCMRNHGDLFQANDLIVVPDAGNAEGTMVEIAEKSMLWLKCTVSGRQCHASTPEKGRNSLLGAADLILRLQGLRERFSDQDDLFEPPISTFEPTKMEANVPNVNTIPGRDVFYMDCRILPQHSVDEVLARAREIAADLARQSGFAVDVAPVYRQDALNPTPADAPVVKALGKAINYVTGLDAQVMGIGGGTVAAFFRQAGLPAAVWSTVSNSAHQPNEYCLISSIIQDAKVLAHLYLDA
jgi:succinyl-diaminopimelate desuccinylase